MFVMPEFKEFGDETRSGFPFLEDSGHYEYVRFYVPSPPTHSPTFLCGTELVPASRSSTRPGATSTSSTCGLVVGRGSRSSRLHYPSPKWKISSRLRWLVLLHAYYRHTLVLTAGQIGWWTMKPPH